MRVYKHNDIRYKLRSKPNEITLKEFERIVGFNDNQNFEYWLNVIEILGLHDIVDDIDDVNLYQIIKDFNEDFKLEEDYTNKIELGGYTYISHDEEKEFNIKARDLSKIENYINNNKKNWGTYAIALIFKREDLSKIEHTDEDHIKHKMELFKDITLDIALPFLYKIGHNFQLNLNILKDV